jgi:predicted Zn-dependent protease
MKKIFAALFISAYAVGCSTNPVTGRSQFKLVPEQQLQSMAAQEYQQFLSGSKVVSSSNNKDAAMVRRVGQRVTNAVKSYYASRNISDVLDGFVWEYNLVNDPAINAWAMPGGRIVVYTGLLGVTKNEAALAAVIGHEISHAIFKHGNERMSQGLATQLGGTALSVALANKPAQTQNLFNTAFGLGATYGVLMPFSRKQESESDRYGLIWMAMAGYNPQEAIPLWERMEAASSGNKPPEFLSTHPSENTRMTNLKKWMPEALKYYKTMK